MKSIVHISPTISRLGGGVTESLRLLSKIDGRSAEMDISIITTNDSETAGDLETWDGAAVEVTKGLPPARFNFSFDMLKSLLRKKPDLVHVHGIWMGHCLAVYIWSIIENKPYVVTPHGMLETWIRKNSPVLKFFVSTFYQNAFLKRAAGFHILTNKERGDIDEFVSDQIVEIIPNYVEQFTHSMERPNWWVEEFANKDIYLFFGRLHRKKSCEELVSAWASACKKNPTFGERSVLVFCGWIDGMREFEDHIDNVFEQHKNIVYGGPQYGDDKVKSYSSATYFILPSKSEGLPMSVIEAWSAGLPALLTDECNLPDGFGAGAALKLGFLEEEIEAGLLKACALTDEVRAEMKNSALALVAESYSRNSVEKKLIDFYKAAETYWNQK